VKEKIINFINNKIANLIGRIILGSIFIYASLDKIAFPREFAKIVINYNILPEKIAIYFAFILPWIELFFGIFLIVGLFVRVSALALSLLLLVFIVILIIKSLNGTLANCGCFSVSQQDSNDGFLFHIITNAFLLFLGGGLFCSRLKKISLAASHGQAKDK